MLGLLWPVLEWKLMGRRRRGIEENLQRQAATAWAASRRVIVIDHEFTTAAQAPPGHLGHLQCFTAAAAAAAAPYLAPSPTRGVVSWAGRHHLGKPVVAGATSSRGECSTECRAGTPPPATRSSGGAKAFELFRTSGAWRGRRTVMGPVNLCGNIVGWQRVSLTVSTMCLDCVVIHYSLVVKGEISSMCILGSWQ